MNSQSSRISSFLYSAASILSFGTMMVACSSKEEPHLQSKQEQSHTPFQNEAAPSKGHESPAPSTSAKETTSPPPNLNLEALKASLEGKTVLHCGDSMVGGAEALTKALQVKFKEYGVKKFVSHSEVSVGIPMFDKTPKFKQMLTRHHPDIVILTLGANDVFSPAPESLSGHVRNIVKKMSASECYWISPPTWKPDTGIVDVIAANIAPCKFYDSRNMDIPRAKDHIHPTDKGGAIWADKFWDFFIKEHPISQAPPSPK